MSTTIDNKAFLNDNFLLEGEAAQSLFHDVAKDLPIIDYHNHLPPEDVASNRKFNDLTEIWLEGDHYKWRAMRANGVDEKFCTGDADPYDKFFEFAKTMPYLLRNPLYHWSHLELRRYFDVDLIINEQNAKAIWDAVSDQISDDRNSAQGILERFNVEVICTTDDPAQPLKYHEEFKKTGSKLKMLPTFRPDGAFKVNGGKAFTDWLESLTAASGVTIQSFDDLLEAIKKRHDDFHAFGGRLSDHGLNQCFGAGVEKADAEAIFDRGFNGAAVTDKEVYDYSGYLMVYLGQLDAEKDWTKQIHLGAYRNVNAAKMSQLGPDTGFDSIGDFSQAEELGSYFNKLESLNSLPKAVIYNLNPAQNYVFATLAGNFQDGSVPGKIQFGSGWWFLDQKEGMEWQMNALSSLGLLSRFVGMLTDSRSFLSFPRHEYFRRILCNLLGNDMDKGLIPNDFELAANVVKGVCYHNARNFFGFYE